MPQQSKSRRLNIELDESIGFLIADTGRYVKRSLYVRIAEYGIRGGCWFALRSLWQQDGVTQRELSHRLGLMAPSVLEMIRTMERDGLVRCERDPADRRKVRVYLTERARKLERKLMTIANRLNGTMLHGLTAEEEIQLKLLLRKLRDTLGVDFATYAEAKGTASGRAAVTRRDAQSDPIATVERAAARSPRRSAAKKKTKRA